MAPRRKDKTPKASKCPKCESDLSTQYNCKNGKCYSKFAKKCSKGVVPLCPGSHDFVFIGCLHPNCGWHLKNLGESKVDSAISKNIGKGSNQTVDIATEVIEQAGITRDDATLAPP
jgi:hypothetical protein